MRACWPPASALTISSRPHHAHARHGRTTHTPVTHTTRTHTHAHAHKDWTGNCRKLEAEYKRKYVEEPTKFVYVFVCGSGQVLGWATLASRQSE